jgi:cytochrome d ubiquinol oxidase subunit I
MDALTLARWQFGITTVYHFLIVPLTIGLAPLVAGLETAWVRTGKAKYLRATKFWGKLFLINFALGVATGIVQEFQFGMNWSDYSRFVGDIFGAPLAMEGLMAFFLESTFLGLWIFGWDRLAPRVHLACIWIVSVGTLLSAYFILAANSWMQHPVGYQMMPNGRPQLNDIWAVLGNSTQLVTFPHVVLGALVTGGVVMVSVSAWHLKGGRNPEVFRPSMKLGLITTLVASVGTVISGDVQARIMTEQQPMKMAAAEALYSAKSGAPFSLFTIGSLNGREEVFSLRVPNVLSFMATGSLNGRVEGINDVQSAYQARYGFGDYIPYVPVTYWGFRLMIGFGALAALVALIGLLGLRGGRTPSSRWFWRIGIAAVVLPFLANSFGWIFTEMGRQPWSVFGLLKTATSVSPTVSMGEVLTSLIAFTLLYGVLAVIALKLMVRYAKEGPPSEEDALAGLHPPKDEPGGGSGGAQGTSGTEPEDERPLVFAY